MTNGGVKKPRYSRDNVRQIVYPLALIKEAVAEIESGQLSVSEAAKKHGVHRQTIQNWLRKYSTLEEEAYIQQGIPNEVKREVVAQIEQGFLTRKEAAKQCKVTYSTISVWLATYSCKPKINPEEMQELVSQEQRSDELVKKENAELRLSVKELQLKVAGLETMIDLAEKEYNVPIRKKSGTKQ